MLVLDWDREVLQFVHVAVMNLLVSGVSVMFGSLHASLLVGEMLLHSGDHVEKIVRRLPVIVTSPDGVEQMSVLIVDSLVL